MDHILVSKILISLAGLLKKANRLDEAEPFFRRALEINQEALGVDHPDTLKILYKLAQVLFIQDKLDDAKQAYTRLVGVLRTLEDGDALKIADAFTSFQSFIFSLKRSTRLKNVAGRF